MFQKFETRVRYLLDYINLPLIAPTTAPATEVKTIVIPKSVANISEVISCCDTILLKL